MQGIGIVAVSYQLVGYLLGVAAGAAEYDGVDVGRIVGYTLKSKVFVACIDHVVDVAYIGGTFVAVADDEFHGVMHVFLGNACYFGRHGG